MSVKGVAILLLVAALAALASVVAPTANAQAGNLPALDLSLESSPITPTSPGIAWTVTVHNHQIPGHPPLAARNVVVRTTVTVDGQELSGTYTDLVNLSRGRFDASTGEWTIPLIPPSGSAQAVFYSPAGFWPGNWPVQAVPFRLYAELVDPNNSGEWPPSPANNETETWYVQKGSAALWPYREAAVQVGVSNRRPALDTLTTFEIVANRFETTPHHFRPVISGDHWDVQVKIELSPGLSFSPTLAAPAGRPFESDTDTGIWEVGYIGDLELPTLSVPVTFTGADIPLEQRCLTATIVHALPAFAFDAEIKENDAATVCLGDDPPVVVSTGEMALFWFHNCVGDTAPPCGSADELKLFAQVDHDKISVPAVQRRDTFVKGSTYTYLDTESVIVQVRDPDGRSYDDSANSVNSGGRVSWRTAEEAPEGVVIEDALEDFGQGYTSFSRTLSLTGWEGSDAPGKMNMRISASGFAWFRLVAEPVTQMMTPTDKDFFDAMGVFYEFEELGTYALNYYMALTLTDNSVYTDAADYVFHVGPISELAVGDGGPSPLATPDQQAYTIHAANNGPDAAPAVEVTLTGAPQGAEVTATDGTYREVSCNGDGLCEAVWDLSLIHI